MSRQNEHVQPAPFVTKRTRLDTLPDIDPDAVQALAEIDIHTIGQLRQSDINLAECLHRHMPNRPRTASLNAHNLARYRSMQLSPSIPPGMIIHDRLDIKQLPNIPPEVVAEFYSRGITTLGQIRGRKSQISTILERALPNAASARTVKAIIQHYLNPSQISMQTSAPSVVNP